MITFTIVSRRQQLRCVMFSRYISVKLILNLMPKFHVKQRFVEDTCHVQRMNRNATKKKISKIMCLIFIQSKGGTLTQ